MYFRKLLLSFGLLLLGARPLFAEGPQPIAPDQFDKLHRMITP